MRLQFADPSRNGGLGCIQPLASSGKGAESFDPEQGFNMVHADTIYRH